MKIATNKNRTYIIKNNIYIRIVNGKIEQTIKKSPSYLDDNGIIEQANKAYYQTYIPGIEGQFNRIEL